MVFKALPASWLRLSWVLRTLGAGAVPHGYGKGMRRWGKLMPVLHRFALQVRY